MTWDGVILNAGNSTIWRKAWRMAQRVRARIEKITEHFFEELTTVGVDVFEPPELGKYTPDWEPLSESWTDRKGHGNFFFDRGDLERSLLRKSTQGVFGRPQVFLEFDGSVVKVNAGSPAKKYSGQSLRGLKIRAVPFPRLWTDGPRSPEELIAAENDTLYFKLTSAGSPFNRPLVSPFVEWFTHVKVRKAMKEALA
jgi:hypothetical protein